MQAGSLAERYKALVLGTQMWRRGFETQRCQYILFCIHIKYAYPPYTSSSETKDIDMNI